MKQLKNLFKNCVDASPRIVTTLLLILTLNNSQAQVEDVKRIVQELCAPNFHGRGYVNGGDTIAASYIARQFQEVGLQNITPNYFQTFNFQVNSFPGRVDFAHVPNYWEHKNNEAIPLQREKLITAEDVLPDAACPSYKGTLIYRTISARDILNSDLIIEYLSEAIAADSINSMAIDYRNTHPDTLKLVSGFKYELAKFIPVIIITDEKFTWSVAQKQLLHPIFELKGAKYTGAPLQVNIYALLQENHQSRNVIGYLPGKGTKTIVFTAHYDHLGRLGQDTYFPGANDNASGTAMIIALAKYFQKHPIKYNILFIAFAGEEVGLLGSEHYVNNPILPLKDIKFLLNLDIFGSGEEGITVVNGTIHKEHFELLQKINEEKQLLKAIKARGYAANSDHYWFTKNDVPAFFIYTQGPNKHYHDVHDLYENLSFAEVNDLATLMATFIERLGKLKVKKKKS